MEALGASQGLHFMEFVPTDGAVCALLLQCGIQDRSVYINLALLLILILCLIYGTKRSWLFMKTSICLLLLKFWFIPHQQVQLQCMSV